MELKRCYGCMRELSAPGIVCPHCGFDNTKDPASQPSHVLPCGTVLNGQYLVGRSLGQGGFGITYIGYDLNLEIPVCIKEYYPEGSASRVAGQSSGVYWGSSDYAQTLRDGRTSFVREARKAVKLRDLNHVVTVWGIFFENETAYIIMDYIEGETLKSRLVRTQRPLGERECVALLTPVMRDLEKIHERGIIHRDIKPENLMIRSDGELMLLDMGAAKDLSTGSGQSSFMVASQGFSPLEQYNRNGRIGPWTDVYGVCATIYYCLTGRRLPTPTERMSGEKIDWQGLTPEMKSALEKGLALQPEDRTQTMGELLRALHAEAEPETIVDVTIDPDGERWYGNRYRTAKELMEKGEYETAESIFSALGMYVDSPALAEECRKRIPEEKQKREAEAEKKQKKKKRARLLGFIALLLLILLIVLWTACKNDTDAGTDTSTVLPHITGTGSKAEDYLEAGDAALKVYDYPKALEAYAEADRLGSAAAKAKLGYLYEKGLGVYRDYQKAFELYSEGAEAGDANAVYRVGLSYYYAIGVQKDYVTALSWCLKAAEAGNADAMYWVSTMYRYGQGTEVNLELAESWRQKALEAGYQE